MIRDDDEFAKKITGYLDSGAAGMRAGTLYKLQQARARALAALPDRWIHRPWEASAAVLATAKVTLGKTYPRPIVCLAGSRAAALWC